MQSLVRWRACAEILKYALHETQPVQRFLLEKQVVLRSVGTGSSDQLRVLFR